MKRLIVVILLLFAGAVVALPGAVGLIAERQHDRFVEQINANGDRLIEDRYERSWFSTRTRHRYRIEDEQLRKLIASVTQEPQGIPELLVESDIFHGPVPVITGGPGRDLVGWSDVDSSFVLLSPSGVETSLPGELRSRIEPDGSTRFVYHADAESRSLRDGLTLSWAEADIDIAVGRSRNTLAINGQAGSIELSDGSAAIRIGPTVVVAAQRQSRRGLWTGDTSIRIDQLSHPAVAADNLLFETRVSESSGQATYALKLDADNVQGAAYAGKQARVDFYAERLDAEAVSELFQLLVRYRNPAQIPEAQLDSLLNRLLMAGPEVSLKTLKIPMPDADIEGNAFVSIFPGTGIALNDLTDGARGNATLLVPRQLVDQIKSQAAPEMQATIEMMMRLRVLVAEGKRYRIEAAYANNLLTVNGFPIPVPKF